MFRSIKAVSPAGEGNFDVTFGLENLSTLEFVDDGDDTEDDMEMEIVPLHEIDDIEPDEDELAVEAMLVELDKLSSLEMLCDVATESGLGFTPALLAVSLREDLLSGTSAESYSTESIGTDYQAALEGVLGAIKDKIGSMASHAMDFVKRKLGSLVTGVTGLAGRLSAMMKRISTKISDTAKAHPYATAAVAVTAIVAVTAVVMVMTGTMPSGAATSETLKAGVDKIRAAVARIKSPFAKFSIVDTAKGFKLAVTNAAKDTTHAMSVAAGKVGKMASKASAGAGDAAAAAGKSIKNSARTIYQTADSASGWTATNLKSLCDMCVKHCGELVTKLKDLGMASFRLIKSMSGFAGNTAVDAAGVAGSATKSAAGSAGSAIASAATRAGGAVKSGATSAAKGVASAARAGAKAYSDANTALAKHVIVNPAMAIVGDGSSKTRFWLGFGYFISSFVVVATLVNYVIAKAISLLILTIKSLCGKVFGKSSNGNTDTGLEQPA